jgi:two-component system chemotaxis response regulator CheB
MVRVLIVDDSAIIRAAFQQALDEHPQIEVVATAVDPFDARDKLIRLRPDVMTLDIQMPRMNGLTFLKKVMTHFPVRTVVISSLSPSGSNMAMKALDIGAVDVMGKPSTYESLKEWVGHFCQHILAAARYKNIQPPESRVKVFHRENVRHLDTSGEVIHPLEKIGSIGAQTPPLIMIGASTGGTQAITRVLTKLPGDMPPILITQHMPAGFTASFAQRLNQECALTVKEAQNGDELRQGTAYLAPGGYHMVVRKKLQKALIVLTTTERVHFQRPAVEEMFRSGLELQGRNIIAVLLTGMGEDGARTLFDIRQAGGYTIAQDEKTSAVWGMPGAAVKLNAAVEILPLDKIAGQLVFRLRKKLLSGHFS